MPASEREWAQRRQAEELERGRRDRERVREGYGPNPHWRDGDEERAARIRAGRMLLLIFGTLWLAGAILHVAQGAI